MNAIEHEKCEKSYECKKNVRVHSLKISVNVQSKKNIPLRLEVNGGSAAESIIFRTFSSFNLKILRFFF